MPRIAAALVLTLQIVAIVLGSSDASAAQLTVSWTDRSNGAAATGLERRLVDDSVFESVADVPAGVTEYVDTGLSPGSTYCYRAVAHDETGVSDYSNEACATPADEPLLSVTVHKTGDGTGTIGSMPHGLLCGARCSATYPASTVVRLIAIPAVGSAFVGWSGGGCFGTGSCTVAGNSAVSVTASFGSLAVSADPGALPPPDSGRRRTAEMKRKSMLDIDVHTFDPLRGQLDAADDVAMAEVEQSPAVGEDAATTEGGTGRGQR